MWVRVAVGWDAALFYAVVGLLSLGIGYGADQVKWRLISLLFTQVGVVFVVFAVFMPLMIWRRDRDAGADWSQSPSRSWAETHRLTTIL